jgi:dTDP-4-dehydrorhamnose reductase
MTRTRVLVIGGSGMLGHKVFQVLASQAHLEAFVTVRSAAALPPELRHLAENRLRTGVDAENFDTMVRALAAVEPEVVINCIGVIKQLPEAHDALTCLSLNAQLPHRLSLLCRAAGARLIHVSTDCVFEGDRGGYIEEDRADANDLYGRTKYLGEVTYPHCVTLRTSIIGHELRGHHGLVDWFLRAGSLVKGYRQAFFSGLPTVELSRVIADQVIPRPDISGLVHVSADRISKYDLLCLIRERYDIVTEIQPTDDVRIDRSLRSQRFGNATGYQAPGWRELIARMHQDFVEHRSFYSA